MKFSANNFLTLVKNIVMGGGLMADGVTPHNDAGFVVDRQLTSSKVVAAANTTAVATFTLLIPRDYDEATDEFTIDIVADMAGATDTPTITLAPDNGGDAMTASSGTLVTAALSATATKYTFKLNGNGLTRDSIVTLVFTSGAHTTDALNFLSVRTSYRSTLVSYNETDGATPQTGNSLR